MRRLFSLTVVLLKKIILTKLGRHGGSLFRKKGVVDTLFYYTREANRLNSEVNLTTKA